MIRDTTTTPAPAFHDSRRGRRHQSWVLCTAAVATLLGLTLPTLPIDQQFWIVLIPIVVVGLSHGGADLLILEQLMRHRRLSVAQATALYLLATAAFVALIWWMPVIALVAFLLLSAWHFGYTDVGFTHRRSSHAVIWLSGGLPIIGPVAGHPVQTGELFAWLIVKDPLRVSEFLHLIGPMLGIAWLIGFAIIACISRGGNATRALLELALLASAMYILPPLLAFAYYFCVVHSLRHFLVIAEFGQGRTEQQPILGPLARLVAPATATAFILALLAWALIVMLEPDSRLMTEAVRVMFWALAALTLPHALAVTLWWRHDRAA